jgi:hypothetical protein
MAIMAKKRVILILSLVFIFSCSKKPEASQDTPVIFRNPEIARGNLDGFLDIAWGESVENAVRVLEEKGYTCMPWDDLDDFVSAEGKFAGQEAELWLSFFEGRFYSGTIVFPYEKTESEYDEYVSIVTEKYGEPSIVVSIPPSRRTRWNFYNDCDIDVLFLVRKVHISYIERNLYDRHREWEDAQKERERQAVKNSL